jgi:UDP-N-acetylmuramoylalanine--D-glutamate ligase
MFKNKKIFILGFARSGYEAAKVLIKRNNEVIINDKKIEQDESQVNELKELGVNIVLGEHPEDLLDDSFDYLIKNPGVPTDHMYVKKAEQYGIPVINEVELAFALFPKDIKIIGITGTNGKTTTTTLIYEILKQAGLPVHLTGNIGYPLCSFIDKVKSGDIIVMEVSVQQLLNTKDFKTDISVMTNLFEAHIDFLKTYENYINTKAKIFNHHDKDSIAILNLENADVIKVTENIKSTKKYFSSKQITDGAYILDNKIYNGKQEIIELNDIRVSGIHNYENIMAAIMVVKEFDVKNSVIKEVLEDFGGVEHRLEYVEKKDGREIYNDSKATNTKATQIALSAFSKPTIVLLGGMERGQDFMDLKDFMTNVKHIVCYGETKTRISDFAKQLNIDCIAVDTLEEATKASYQISEVGDIILLSPACASWDQFKDFEERGKMFKEYVEKL